MKYPDDMADGNSLDFKLLFESAPGLFLILRPDSPRFTILGASDAYLAATHTQRDRIVGRGLFEVFPDNPDDPNASGTRNLKASLERVLSRLEPDTMAVQKYDVRKADGSFEERHWSPINSPVRGRDGELRYILHRVEDVTGLVQAHETDALRLEVLARSEELKRLTQQQRTEIQLATLPLIHLGFDAVLVPIIGVLDDARMAKLMPRLLDDIQRYRHRLAVIDLTGMTALDPRVTVKLTQMLSAARAMGAEVMVSGMSETCAVALVEAGVEPTGMRIVGELSEAIAVLCRPGGRGGRTAERT